MFTPGDLINTLSNEEENGITNTNAYENRTNTKENASKNSTNMAMDGTDTRFGPPPILASKFSRRMWVGGSISFCNTSQTLAAFSTTESLQQVASVAHAKLRPVASLGGCDALFVWSNRSIFHDNDSGDLLLTDSRCHCYKPINFSLKNLADQSSLPLSNILKQVGEPFGQYDFESSFFSTDAIKLFQYSSLTFNSHRIHYDSEYARSVEGYPDILVHAPYTATLILEEAREFAESQIEDSLVEFFEYRAESPLVVGVEFRVRGKWRLDHVLVGDSVSHKLNAPRKRSVLDLWAVREGSFGGGIVMSATVVFGNNESESVENY
ncbi:hypothetical protein HK100_009442 [Physocladia obscura]|uniref:Uncharacterized protein n=1 Tax=Physocladia obscura TaxID=109957 RepID=A0AAD5XE76_9FUNG|nr:hypothetical protein HK100_009442 [Physocladia obscura]